MHHVILDENLQTTLNITPLQGIHLAKGRIYHFYSFKLLFGLQQKYTQTLPEAKWGSGNSCWKLAIAFILTPCIRLSIFICACILFGDRSLEFCSINTGPQTVSLENYVLACCIWLSSMSTWTPCNELDICNQIQEFWLQFPSKTFWVAFLIDENDPNFLETHPSLSPHSIFFLGF